MARGATNFGLAAMATNQLAVDLHRQPATRDENLCVSPYSNRERAGDDVCWRGRRDAQRMPEIVETYTTDPLLPSANHRRF
jgi:hypothetical protein